MLKFWRTFYHRRTHKLFSRSWTDAPARPAGQEHLSTVLCDKMDHSQQPYWLPSVIHGLSHGLRRRQGCTAAFPFRGTSASKPCSSSPHKALALRGPLVSGLNVTLPLVVPPFRDRPVYENVPEGTRLHLRSAQIKVRLRQAVGGNSPPDCCI